MRFLIAGYGSIGRRHFHNLRSLGVEDILFYRTHKSSINDQELAGFVVETDLEKALSHGPDAVIISNPTALHLDVAVPAAQAGCHILLEKPVSDSLAGVGEFQDLVDQSGVRVLVGFQFRYHPGLNQMDHLLGQGRIGRPLSFRAHWGEYLPGWHPWEDYRQGYSARRDLGGGVILTLSHPFDYLRWLLGEIETVWALTGSESDLEIEVEDTAEIGMTFAEKITGSVHLNFTQRPLAHRLEIVGTQGTIRWDYLQGELKVYDIETQTWQSKPTPPGFERNDMFLDEMKHFLRVVQGAESPRCSLADGVRVQRVIAAIKESARTGSLITV